MPWWQGTHLTWNSFYCCTNMWRHVYKHNIRHIIYQEPGWCSRYSDCLQAGRSKGRNSNPSRCKIFLLPTTFNPALGPIHPHIQWVLGACSQRVRRPAHEADVLPPASAEVKNACIYDSTHPYVELCLINWAWEQLLSYCGMYIRCWATTQMKW
jgi:hypothetical protein